jgi:hypothetical protein
MENPRIFVKIFPSSHPEEKNPFHLRPTNFSRVSQENETGII